MKRKGRIPGFRLQKVAFNRPQSPDRGHGLTLTTPGILLQAGSGEESKGGQLHSGYALVPLAPSQEAEL